MSKENKIIFIAFLVAFALVASCASPLRASEEEAAAEVVAEPEETYIPEVEEAVIDGLATEEPIVEVVEISEEEVSIVPEPTATEEPTPTPTEEPTPCPTAEPTAEPEETPFDPDAPDRDHELDVQVWFDYEEPLDWGSTIYILSSVSGGYDYTYTWFYSTDDANWIKIPGANEPTYTYTLTAENCDYYWLLYVEGKCDD